MATNIFNDIRTKAGDTERSYTWYQAQIKKLGAARPETFLAGKRLQNTILPGKMYLFAYDPKFKATLPYYDKFPLVLPFRLVKRGFYGLNIHYLPYLTRFRLLQNLADLVSDESKPEDVRLNLSWKILNVGSKYAPINACVKHYLNEHIESRFLNIPYPDWVTASQLPIERFVGATKTEVWKQSRTKY